MKKAKYIGGPVHLGRFGEIDKGHVLNFMESEWACLVDDPRFKLLTKVPSKEEKEIASRVKPLGTAECDLRAVPWSQPKLINILVSRCSIEGIKKIIRAINAVGGFIETPGEFEHKTILADHIVTAALYMGWDKLTREEILTLPMLGEDQTEGAPTRRRVRVAAT